MFPLVVILVGGAIGFLFGGWGGVGLGACLAIWLVSMFD